MKSKIADLIYLYLEDFNKKHDVDKQLSICESTEIYGQSDTLDSLGIVNLLLYLEETIKNQYNLELELVDEHIVSWEKNPFLTVSSLANYTEELIAKMKSDPLGK